MVAEALARQAELLSERTGQTLEEALAAILKTGAGSQLAELADGPHRHRKARDWQDSMLRKRAEERLLHLVGPEAKEAARALGRRPKRRHAQSTGRSGERNSSGS